MKKELISVIVPVYNVESYLSKCIDSLINQTYKNLEIILIDDGSPDNSGKICDDYAKKDKRIKVIHKKNGGLSDARNKGIEQAKGSYLSFIDSDDYIELDMLEKLYLNLKENKSDISICNIILEYPKKNQTFKFHLKEFTVRGKEKFENLYNDYNIVTIIACNKLYKKELFKEIKYPNGRVNEDEFVIFDILDNSDKISYFDEKLYHYIQRENSIMHKFNLNRLDIVELHKERIKKLENKKELDILKLEYLSYIQTLIKIIIPGLNSINEVEKEKMYINEVKNTIKFIKIRFRFNIKEKLKLIFIFISPKFYVKIFKK